MRVKSSSFKRLCSALFCTTPLFTVNTLSHAEDTAPPATQEVRLDTLGMELSKQEIIAIRRAMEYGRQISTWPLDRCFDFQFNPVDAVNVESVSQ